MGLNWMGWVSPGCMRYRPPYGANNGRFVGKVVKTGNVVVLHHLECGHVCTIGVGGIVPERWLWCYTIMWTGWLVGCSPPLIHLLLIHCFRRPGGGWRGGGGVGGVAKS